ncbi:MAG: hypothetical protein EON93_21695 [Burkholderiales bacterium]|nr:MAG: hypothetical protein EON93_21695 [Burkholderiales bacterium]
MLQNFPDLRAATAEKKGVKKFTLHCVMYTAHARIIMGIEKNAAPRLEGGTNVAGCVPPYSLYPHMRGPRPAANPACADNSLISDIFPQTQQGRSLPPSRLATLLNGAACNKDYDKRDTMTNTECMVQPQKFVHGLLRCGSLTQRPKRLACGKNQRTGRDEWTAAP